MLASDRLRRFTRWVHIPRVSTMASSSGSGVFVGAARLNWGSTCMLELSIDTKDCSNDDESGGAYGYKVKNVAVGSRESSQTVTNATTGCGKVMVCREKIDFEN